MQFFSAGFTIIELLVVIAMISLLSAVIFSSLNSARAKARDARRIADLKQIAIALELYFDSNGEYPPDPAFCDTSGGFSSDCTPGSSGVVLPGWDTGGFSRVSPTFMSSLPKDPINIRPNFYYYEPVDNETQFGKTCSGGFSCAYIFSALLENSNPSPGCNACFPTHNYCISGGGTQLGATC